jgi:urate oxidase
VTYFKIRCFDNIFVFVLIPALPDITSGIKGLRVIKTTQSGFEHFIHDEFATLPDLTDRIFSTIVYAKWHYASTNGVDFDKAWYKI